MVVASRELIKKDNNFRRKQRQKEAKRWKKMNKESQESQRACPVQKGAGQARHQGEQLPVAPRRREGRIAQVVLQVHLRVLHPAGTPQLAQRPDLFLI